MAASETGSKNCMPSAWTAKVILSPALTGIWGATRGRLPVDHGRLRVLGDGPLGYRVDGVQGEVDLQLGPERLDQVYLVGQRRAGPAVAGRGQVLGAHAHDHLLAVIGRKSGMLQHLGVRRASWTLRNLRPRVLTPSTNREVTVLGAVEVSTGAWVYRLGRRCAADFIALLGMLDQAFPRAPAIVVICDNDSIHHARKVTVPQRASPAGAAVRRPVQPARQPGR
jgi:hypothetical protein